MNKTIKKFQVSVSIINSGMVAVWNNSTNDFANQNLKSLKKIKRTFKTWLNNDTTMTFEHFPNDRINELIDMIPSQRISSDGAY